MPWDLFHLISFLLTNPINSPYMIQKYLVDVVFGFIKVNPKMVDAIDNIKKEFDLIHDEKEIKCTFKFWSLKLMFLFAQKNAL